MTGHFDTRSEAIVAALDELEPGGTPSPTASTVPSPQPSKPERSATTRAGMPSGWVLLATYLDAEGDSCTAFATNNGARVHETLGLLALGKAVWEAEALDWVRGE